MCSDIFVVTTDAQATSCESIPKGRGSTAGTANSLSQTELNRGSHELATPGCIFESVINGCRMPDKANGIASNKVTFLAAGFRTEFDSSLGAARWWEPIPMDLQIAKAYRTHARCGITQTQVGIRAK